MDESRIIGTSRQMQNVLGLLEAVAPSDATVLLEGETGTGKELAAETLHRKSPRCDKPFNVIDCGALPSSLIESELFGHEKGAFTGAINERRGVFEQTRGGTVLLDEIGEIPLHLQPRLLRVIDRRTIKRVGGNLPLRIDVRLVAATNRDLEAEVERGRFRQDLFYRLSVVRIKLPPLHERREDIPALARHFLRQAGAPDPDAVLRPVLIEALRAQRWPGNVRELRNVIERAMVMIDAKVEVDCQQLIENCSRTPAPFAEPLVSGPPDGLFDDPMQALLRQPYSAARESVMDQFETAYLVRLLEQHGNNISAIARDAGIDRNMARKLLRRRGLYHQPPTTNR